MGTEESFRVLVVDNDPVFRAFGDTFFRARDQYVVVAESGLEALGVLERDSIDVVITDLVMPNIDGAMLCSIIRANPSWAEIRTVLVSAAAKEAIDDLLAIGADLYIAKGPLAQMGPQLERALELLASGDVPSGTVLGIEGVHSRRITRELLWENRLLYSVLDGIAEASLFVAPDGSVIKVNPAAASILGMDPLTLIGKKLYAVAPELRAIDTAVEGSRLELSLGSRLFEAQKYRVDAMDRSITTILLRDISKERAAVTTLEKTLADRELLLREIHHRIKNNLLGINSYISLLKSENETEGTKQALESVEAHIGAIARVHERLYESTTLSTVSGGRLLRDLVEDLVALFGRDQEVKREYDLDDVELSVETSVPLGLIIAEVVTNALRHAISDDGLLLSVMLRRDDAGRVRLQIQDDGPGIPESVLSEERISLGLTVMRGLAHQLKASIQIDGRKGTTVTLILPPPA